MLEFDPMKNNFIILNGAFYNIDFIVRIISSSTPTEDWSSGKCVFTGKYRPRAYIVLNNEEKALERTLEKQAFETHEEAEARAQEIIQRAISS